MVISGLKNQIIIFMKYKLLVFFFLFSGYSIAQEHTNTVNDDVLITISNNKTEISYNSSKQLCLNVSEKDVEKFKSNGFVIYKNFGAKGDGKTDDIDAICATHAFANQEGLTVKINDNATYYISGKSLTAEIQTNTDFGTASFIIDDTKVENRSKPVFLVSSFLKPYKLKGISTLKKNQHKIDAQLTGACIISVSDSNVKRYIRFGLNQNNGFKQTDIFMVDKDGNVDANSPIIWDFEQITEITALPIDDKTLTISGGRFTTIANQAESAYNYYSRGIAIKRSNVVVDSLEHHVTGEGEHGAPYNGFIHISDCSNVRVQNTKFTGHKMYKTIGSAGALVSMGSYDFQINRALNVSFVNCKQLNDINDRRYWGIMGSNYCKNIVYDSCSLSRFDAHMGVVNGTIRNSVLGHQGINAIGKGTFTVENSSINANQLINLRPDYGSTWEGEIIIRNCILVPKSTTNVCLISGSYSGQHNFGYTCYMPERITIENLRIDDSKRSKTDKDPYIFGDFNPKMTDESYIEKFPYIKTKEVILNNAVTSSGKDLKICENSFMFKDVKVLTK